MTIDYKQLSKTMAHALRHDPKQYGLQLDLNGWVEVVELVEALKRNRRNWQALDRAVIESMIADADKKRYEIDGEMIRAVYGHSSGDIEISYEPSEPPEILYHGTTPSALALIKETGLKPMQRKFVHLSPDLQTAVVVAKRRTGKPQIIKVRALDAYKDGIQFYYGHDQVWLTSELSPGYLIIEE